MAWIDVHWWSNQLHAGSSGDRQSAIADERGVLLAFKPFQAQIIGLDTKATPGISGILAGETSQLSVEADDGSHTLWSAAPIVVAGGGRLWMGVASPEAIVFERANAIPWRGVFAIATSILLSLSLVWISVGLLVVRPVYRIRSAAGRVAEGDLSARTGLQGLSGELGFLAREFDAMAEQLQESEPSRKRMLASIAHDLKNPLEPLSLRLYLMKQAQPPLPLEQQGHLAAMEHSLRRLRALLEDFMAASRLERGTFSVAPAAVDVSTAVKTAIAEYAPKADRRRMRIETDIDGGTVRADPLRLEQVLLNLVGNAVKFSPDGSTIRIRAKNRGEGWRFEVEDQGPGVSAADQARLFRAFAQLQANTPEAASGMGLGLYICRGIVEAHGGKIGIVSEGEDQGSTFWFELPAGPVSA